MKKVISFFKKYFAEFFILIGAGIFISNLSDFSHYGNPKGGGLGGVREVSYYYSDSTIFCITLGVVMIVLGILIIKNRKIKMLNPFQKKTEIIKTETKNDDKKINGLGGWLIFVCIGMFVNSIRLLGSILLDNYILNDEKLATVEKVMNGYSALIAFDNIISTCALMILIYLIILFFKKSISFPKYYIKFMIICIIFGIIEYCLAISLNVSDSVHQVKSQLLFQQSLNMVIAIFSAIIWGLYLKKSIRVKNTFIIE